MYSGSAHTSLWPSNQTLLSTTQQVHCLHTTAMSCEDVSDSEPAHFLQDQFSHMKYWEQDNTLMYDEAQQEFDKIYSNTLDADVSEEQKSSVDYNDVYWNQFAGHSKEQTCEKMQNDATDSSKKSCEVDKDVSFQALSHVNVAGEAQMVDVSGKTTSIRQAVARAEVSLGSTAFGLVRENKMKKGDVLGVARVAGIMAAKRTWELIPLCHPLPIDNVDILLELQEKLENGEECHRVIITAQTATTGRTGVEMEALTAVTVAALTVYDMCKAVTHNIIISEVCLVAKTGGKRNFSRL